MSVELTSAVRLVYDRYKNIRNSFHELSVFCEFDRQIYLL